MLYSLAIVKRVQKVFFFRIAQVVLQMKLLFYLLVYVTLYFADIT